MPISDKFTKASTGTRPVPTTLAATRVVGQTTITCDDLTGWPADGDAVHFIIYTLDNDGHKVNGSQLDCKGVVAGSTLTNIDYIAGTDSGNAAGAVVQASPTAGWADDLVDGLKVEHKVDGTHDAITATTVTTTGRVTAGVGLTVSSGTVVLPPASIEKVELEKPHYNALIWSTTGGGSGQVIDAQAIVNFDASDTTNNVGITATTGAGAYLTIARDGLYMLSAQAHITDASGAYSKTVVSWFTLTFDAGSTFQTIRGADRLVTSLDYSTISWTVPVWLPAAARVSLQLYSNPAAVRFGAPDPAGGMTSYLARRNFGTHLSVTEIR